jgi:hypothetical protein
MSLTDVIDKTKSVFDDITQTINKIIPDAALRSQILSDIDISRTKASYELDKLQAQMDMDATKSPKWRNELAYICVTAIAYHSLLHPIILQIATGFGHPIPSIVFDMGDLNQLIYALLGLAGFEVAHSSVKSYLKTQETINGPGNSTP